MPSRALVPIVLCATTLWPLWGLACINSMGPIARDVTVPLWLDLVPWTLGAVFLNRVVLVNVRGPAAMEQPQPSWFRRAFFLLVGAAIFLVLTTLAAGWPLANLTSEDLDRCTGSRPLILALVVSPVVLLILQAAFFQGTGKRLLSDKRRVALASLVVSSVLLVMGLRFVRDAFIIPQLCPLATVGRPPGPYD